MMCVEAAGERPEGREDQLGLGGDEATARDLAAAMGDPQFGMEMTAELRPGLGRIGFVAQDQAVHLGLLDDRAAAMIRYSWIVIAGDPGPARRAGERGEQRPRGG